MTGRLLLFLLLAIDGGISTGPAILDCPNHDILKKIAPNNEYVLISWTEPSSIEGTLEQNSHTSPHYFRRGDHKIRYTFTDGIQTSECTFYVIVIDDDRTDPSPPRIQCPDDVTATVSSATQVVSVTWPPPVISDNSGLVKVVNQSAEQGSNFPFGFTPVTITVQDENNLTASCTFMVKVGLAGDTTPPEINNCPNDITHIAVSERSEKVFWVPPTAQDIGKVRLLFQSHRPGDIFDEGSTAIRILFEDSSGNKAECSFSVTIEVDQVRPEILRCPHEVKQTVTPGQFKTLVWWLEPTATDESGNVNMVNVTKVPGSEFGVGSENVTYYFADNFGNTAKCQFPVIVEAIDNVPPVISNCPADHIEEVPLGTESTSVSWTNPKATDNSGTVILLNSTHVPGSSFPTGPTTVTYLFTDLSENKAACTFTISVTVVDRIKPVITGCPNDFNITLPANGGQVFWGSITAKDDSGEARLQSVSHQSGSLFYEGNTTVSYSFADPAGNEAVCSFIITAFVVSPDAHSKPEVSNCPEDINVTIPSGMSEIAVTWNPEPSLTQNGVQHHLRSNLRSGYLFPVGSTRVEYYNGTPVVCQFVVDVTGRNATDDADLKPRDDLPQHIKIYIGIGSALATVCLLIVIVCTAWITRRCSES